MLHVPETIECVDIQQDVNFAKSDFRSVPTEVNAHSPSFNQDPGQKFNFTSQLKILLTA